MIQELTNSAWNILAKLENDERQGLLTREQAQRQAIDQIQNLHYGQEVKDYFWINDMHPRMVIHPYRNDLNGKDLSDYTDPDGKRVFVEFVNIVKEQGSGFVYYKWQSYDNQNLVLPKISYVKGFAPWGWIIGTGIYMEDIRIEIEEMSSKVIRISLVILLFISLLFTSIISIAIKRRSSSAQPKRSSKKPSQTWRWRKKWPPWESCPQWWRMKSTTRCPAFCPMPSFLQNIWGRRHLSRNHCSGQGKSRHHCKRGQALRRHCQKSASVRQAIPGRGQRNSSE